MSAEIGQRNLRAGEGIARASRWTLSSWAPLVSHRIAARFWLAGLSLLFTILATPSVQSAATAFENGSGFAELPGTVPSGDLLQFLDGSSLHGHLSSMGTNSGVAWQYPDAKELIEFLPPHVAWIRFENPKFVTSQTKPSCRLRFQNGDEIFANVASVDQEHLQLETWFGGDLQTLRQSLQSITFMSKGYSVLYEGPTTADGWVQGRTPRGWEYRDGAFVATAAGTLGRDFRLSGSSSISFDLAWNGHFSLILALYTSVLDRFDYSSSSYMFYLSPGYITLQRVQGGAGAINLGQAQIPEMASKTKMHLELRANKSDSTLGLLVDDHLVQRWKDSSGFVGQGSGVVFFAQLDGPSIKISNVKVAQWEGEFGLDASTNSPSKDDLIYLINHDKVSGKLEQMQDGLLTVSAADTRLKIPLARVSQINFAEPSTNSANTGPWQVRAFFAGGGTISFELEGWKNGRVLGTSRNFGKVDLDSQYIRQLQFNLARSKTSPDEMEILDPDVWELE